MYDLFDISEKIQQFNEQEVVELFKDLLTKEAKSINLPIANLSCPKETKAPDGGIDASIRDGDGKRSDLIFDDYVAYQIKAIKDYKPWMMGKILNELFSVNCDAAKNIALLRGKKTLSDEIFNKLSVNDCKSILKPAIKEYLDKNGVYVTVSFKGTIVEENRIKFEQNIRNILKKCGYDNPKVKLLGYEQLNNVIKTKYPFMALNIKNANLTKGISLLNDIKKTRDFKNEYILDDDRQKIIAYIKSLVDTNLEENRCLNIRVIGQSGIGKTRTVLEAIEQSNYKNNCLYADSYESFENFLPQINGSNNINGVFIVDECNDDQYLKLLDKMEPMFPNIKLITIYNIEEPSENTVSKGEFIEVKKLDDTSISTILDNYNIKDFIKNYIIKYSEGYPRIAVKMTEYVVRDKDCDIMENLDDFWYKYISDYNKKESSETKEKMVILKYLSIFNRFGYSEHFKEETKFIINFLKSKCSYSENTILTNIHSLRERNVLRGVSTIHISPRIFQEWLKKQWWKVNEINFNYEDFVKDMPITLKEEFDKELININENQKINIINSQFQSINDIISKINLFYILAYNCETSAFRHLNRIIDATQDNLLVNDNVSLNNLISYFASFADFFENASNILFRLGNLQKETGHYNNEKNSFSKLFNIFTRGKLSKTNASLEQKIKFLKELYKYDFDEVKTLIILDALKEILQNPKEVTSNELTTYNMITCYTVKDFKYESIPFEYLSEAFDILIDIFNNTTDQKILKNANNILISDMSYLLKNNETAPFGMNCYKKIKNIINIDIAKLISSFQFGFKHNHFNRLNDTNKNALYALCEEIKKSYNYNDFKILCIDKHLEQNSNEYQKIIDYIKNGALDDNNNLEILFDKRCYDAFYIGNGLVLIKNIVLLRTLWDKYKELREPKNIEIILGYYTGLYQTNLSLAESLVINLKNSDYEYKFLPNLIRCVQTEKTIRFFIESIKKGDFDIADFKIYCNNCSLSVTTDVISFLISLCNQNTTETILHIICNNDKRLNFDAKFKINTIKKLLEKTISLGEKFDHDYLLSEIIDETIIKNNKDEIIELFEIILCSDFNDRKGIIENITRYYPNEVWNVLKKNLKKDNFKLIFLIMDSWNSFLLEKIDEDRILSWVNERKEDFEEKLYILGELAPNGFVPDEKKGVVYKFYRNLMCKYNSDDFFNQLFYKYDSVSMVSSVADRLCEKKAEIENLIENEKDPNVLRWLNEQKDYINNSLLREKAMNERRGSDL